MREADAELTDKEMTWLRDHPDAQAQLARVVLKQERGDRQTGEREHDEGERHPCQAAPNTRFRQPATIQRTRRVGRLRWQLLGHSVLLLCALRAGCHRGVCHPQWTKDRTATRCSRASRTRKAKVQ